MKLFTVKFESMYNVPAGLVILADDIQVATAIAKATLFHTEPKEVIEVEMDKAKVVFFESGEY